MTSFSKNNLTPRQPMRCSRGSFLRFSQFFALFWLDIGHSLRLNAEVVKLIGGGYVINGAYPVKFVFALYETYTKWKKKCPKSIQLWLLVKYCTDLLTLGHVQATLLLLFRSEGVLQIFWQKLTQILNDNTVYRSAQATPVLSNI